MEKSFWKGEFFVILTALLWSTSGIFVKSTSMHPILFNGMRCLFAFAVTFIYNRFRLKFNKVILAGGLCFVLANTCLFCAMKFTTVANATVLQYSSTAFVLIETCLLQRKWPSWKHLLILAMAFGGIVVVLSSDFGGADLWGSLLALASGIFFSGIFVVNKLKGSSTLDATMTGYLLSVVLGCFFAGDLMRSQWSDWGAAVYLGVFQMGLAYVLFAKGMRYCSSFNSSVICTLEVLMNPLWVFLFLGETPKPVAIAGGILILSAVILNAFFERDPRGNKRAEAPPSEKKKEPLRGKNL